MDVLVVRPLWDSRVDCLEGEVVAVRGDLAVEDVQNLDVELLPAAVAARTDPVKEKKCISISCNVLGRAFELGQRLLFKHCIVIAYAVSCCLLP